MAEFPDNERISEALNEAERVGLIRFLKTLDADSLDSYQLTINFYICFHVLWKRPFLWGIWFEHRILPENISKGFWWLLSYAS